MLWYIHGTVSAVLVFFAETDSFSELMGNSDSDWAGCKADRKLRSGYVFCVAMGGIPWKTKKESFMTILTAEAVHMALGLAAQKCVWLGRVYAFVTNGLQPVIKINVDNQGSVKIAKNDISGNRTNYIDIRHHLMRQLSIQIENVVQGSR